MLGKHYLNLKQIKLKKLFVNKFFGCLSGLNADDVQNIVIAYEPVWAIGTGKSATVEIAQNTCALVRDEVKNLFGAEVSDKVRIQYGGSVKPRKH